jgi:hypothetical protein
MASKPVQPPVVHGKQPATGQGAVPKPPNQLPNSKHVPVTGKYS